MIWLQAQVETTHFNNTSLRGKTTKELATFTISIEITTDAWGLYFLVGPSAVLVMVVY